MKVGVIRILVDGIEFPNARKALRAEKRKSAQQTPEKQLHYKEHSQLTTPKSTGHHQTT